MATSAGQFISGSSAGDLNIYSAAPNSGTVAGILFGTGASQAARMYINSVGNVGIGNLSPSYLLHVGSSSASGIVAELQNSSGACTHSPGASTETVTCSSDARLKTHVDDSTGALRWLADMRVRDFTVKATGERQTGVVAQELQPTHPDMVHTDASGFYLVDEPNPWKMIKAIQEQQTEIDELKRTVREMSHHQ